ncbi:MAG TPA: malto-oligosyltrehalose synthase [Nitrospira sp.]|nr:malto-oligosyltrehalose synthase [Nitrospira sp.]
MQHVIATYRIQLSADYTLEDTASLVDYLSDLGISHLYLSPILQAAPGSTHGYDVLDHTRISSELGGDRGFERLSTAVSQRGMGILLDIVPNHMAIGNDNRWWWDVLENGQASRYAPYFDVEWQPPESKLHHMVLLPVLGDHYGRVLDAGELHVERHDGAFTVHYHKHTFPIAPRSLALVLNRAAQYADADRLGFFADAFDQLPSSRVTDWANLRRRHRDKNILLALLTRVLQEDSTAAVDQAIEEINNDPQALHHLLERQNYRLAFWRTAERDLGYRRFFDINTLIGLRTEHEQVFADIHELVFKFLTPDGPVEGVRVDHPDGLMDPLQYLERLRDHVHTGWITVEKILMPEERLRSSWPVSGTTGYDFLNHVTGLLLDPDGEDALTQFYVACTGESRSFADILREKKRQVLRHMLGSDVNILTALLLDICERHIHHRDFTRHELHETIQELIICFPVYRTYVRPVAGHVESEDESIVLSAIQGVQRERPDLSSDLLQFIGDILLLRVTGQLETDFAARFQQVTGPTMAKGAEDTAFYCYNRCIALNEVGGNPGRFGLSSQEFHKWCGRIQTEWPHTMLSTSTHDTKRSEDVRARLVVLAEMPARWASQVSSWALRHSVYWKNHAPDTNFQYLWYQTLVGTWPLEPERAIPYCEKAIREAKVYTTWTDPQVAYEEAVKGFVQCLYKDEVFLNELGQLVNELDEYGLATSLSQLLIKLTAPGIPDFYQGSELWNFCLVDPDNRRPVDYELRRHLLRGLAEMKPKEIWERRREGLPKLWIMRRTLHIRRERPHLFGATGTYLGLHATGQKADHVIAYLRGGEILTIAPRWFLKLGHDWGDTQLALPPGIWRNVLDGGRFEGGMCPLKELLSLFPVALLCKDQSK